MLAAKNVTNAEEYLADHFPGFAMLPGVMMLECLVQAARLLVSPDHTPASPMHVRWAMTEVKNLRYGNMVRPGQTLQIEVTVRNRQPDRLDCQGVGRVNDQVAVQGRFSLEPLADGE